jgi:hypothetical protein
MAEAYFKLFYVSSIIPKELKMSKRRSWENEEFIAAVKSSFSIAQTLQKIGLNGAGGNYHQFHKYVKELGIDTSHFTGQGHLKGKTHHWSKEIPLKDIMVEHSTFLTTSHLKKRLVKEGVLKNECNICGISSWLDKQLSLQLDHINGVHNDNRKDNLRILCPNCHSQTATFAGKNKVRQPKIKSLMTCLYCKLEFHGGGRRKYCSNECYQKQCRANKAVNALAYSLKACIFCKKEFVGSPKRKYCTKECFRHEWYLLHK